MISPAISNKLHLSSIYPISVQIHRTKKGTILILLAYISDMIRELNSDWKPPAGTTGNKTIIGNMSHS